jgi:hypothetical protein
MATSALCTLFEIWISTPEVIVATIQLRMAPHRLATPQRSNHLVDTNKADIKHWPKLGLLPLIIEEFSFSLHRAELPLCGGFHSSSHQLDRVFNRIMGAIAV